LIADLFSRLHKVERAGTGIRRMRKSLAEAGLQAPEFEINGFFRAVFHRSPEFSLKGQEVVGKGGQMGGQKRWSELTEKQAAVLEMIRANPRISRGKLAESLSINPSAAQKHMEKLKDRGFIRRVGPDKGGRWEILK
jgi:ATP-dependent DNA helicase RecG